MDTDDESQTRGDHMLQDEDSEQSEEDEKKSKKQKNDDKSKMEQNASQAGKKDKSSRKRGTEESEKDSTPNKKQKTSKPKLNDSSVATEISEEDARLIKMEQQYRHRDSSLSIPVNLLVEPPDWLWIRPLDEKFVNKLVSEIRAKPTTISVMQKLLTVCFGKQSTFN